MFKKHVLDTNDGRTSKHALMLKNDKLSNRNVRLHVATPEHLTISAVNFNIGLLNNIFGTERQNLKFS